jgi:hypothetical protein
VAREESEDVEMEEKVEAAMLVPTPAISNRGSPK